MSELLIDERPAPAPLRTRATLTIAAAGTFLALAAYTLPLADLGTLARAVSAGPTAQIWILSSMSLGLTAAMLLAGALADRYGRRRFFVGGAVVVVAGTVVDLAVGAASPGLRALGFIAGRVIEGIGAAAVIASALALLTEAFPAPEQRAVASSIWGSALGAGITAGPFAAALAGRNGAWWSAYLLLAVLTGALVVASRRVLTESRSATVHPVDPAGTVTFIAAAVLALVALVSIRTAGSAAVPTTLFSLAALAFVAFLIIELRQVRPMLDPRLFRDPRFAGVHLSAFVTGLGSIGLMSVTSTFLIIELGLNGLQTAALIAVWSGTSTLAALAARWLPGRIQGPAQLGIGLLGIAVGQLLLIDTGSAIAAVPGLFLAGIGAGVVNAGLGRETAASSPIGRPGLGSGINNTARYLGSAIGVTICAALLLQGAGNPALIRSGWHAAVLVASAIAAAGGVAVLALARIRARSIASGSVVG